MSISPVVTLVYQFEITHMLCKLYLTCESKNASLNSICLTFAEEEMACLATWKEGNRKYLVAMMNHSHVYNDETRYRCFIYQKQRNNHRGNKLHDDDDREALSTRKGEGRSTSRGARIKMAMSAHAECLGLWNVHEGYKTFSLKKCKSETNNLGKSMYN